MARNILDETYWPKRVKGFVSRRMRAYLELPPLEFGEDGAPRSSGLALAGIAVAADDFLSKHADFVFAAELKERADRAFGHFLMGDRLDPEEYFSGPEKTFSRAVRRDFDAFLKKHPKHPRARLVRGYLEALKKWGFKLKEGLDVSDYRNLY